MNTTFERTKDSQEWYTPKWLIDSLLIRGAKFDLDPCSPINPLFKIAEHTYTIENDGLSQEWFGKVYLNHP